MPKSSPRNAFYAQSGGVTAVINASACGVIETCRRHRSRIGKVYAGRHGIVGALTEDLIDTSKEPAAAIRALRHTPAGAVEMLDQERGYFLAPMRAGIRLIDPRDPVEKVLSEIRGARMLITEAMHGAIVADALRTPWLAALPIHAENQGKWLDWSESLGIELRRHPLQPASLLESYIALTGGRRYYEGRARRWSESVPARPANWIFVELAARHLRKLSREEPQLSADARIGGATDRALEAVETFVKARSRVLERQS
jgi:hypothetical protein